MKNDIGRTSLFIIILFFSFAVNSFAACTGPSPTWTTGGNESADVMECYNEATFTSGDTINVIAGDYWKVIGYIDVAPTDGGAP